MKRRNDRDITSKANRLLQGILISLVIILFRLWHLAVIDHDKKVDEAKRPERRIVIERPERARIFDRFGTLLAHNGPEYRASIVYSDIREIPRTEWREDSSGKKIKVLKRKEYITQLSQKLSHELKIDAEQLEELIHGKAALFGSAPLIIKENLTEKEYARLKMLEKDFPGIRAEIATRRIFPLHKIASHIVGFLGPISKGDYNDLMGEMKTLRACLNTLEEGEEVEFPCGFVSADEVAKRLEILEKRAYTLADSVGRSGVEKSFEGFLRGLCGKRSFLADAKGNFLREIPPFVEKESGQPLYLSISTDLQKLAEELLIEYEGLPIAKGQAPLPPLFPWIKGGAIIVMDPNNGEVLALASYPRFDPNDFVKGQNPKEAIRWLEGESLIARLWDGKEVLTRERKDPKTSLLVEEKKEIDLESYLDFLFPKESKVLENFKKYSKVKDALVVEEKINQLLSLFDKSLSPHKMMEGLFHEKNLTAKEKKIIEEKNALCGNEIEAIKTSLAPYFAGIDTTQDRLLLIDLYRLLIDENRISPSIVDKIKEMPLSQYREAERETMVLFEVIQTVARKTFREKIFKEWKEGEGKKWLADIRKAEKEKNISAKPAYDLFEAEEKRQFSDLWKRRKCDLLLLFLDKKCESDEIKSFQEPLLKEVVRSESDHSIWVERYHSLQERLKDPVLYGLIYAFRSYCDLTRPLFGSYPQLRNEEGKKLEKHLAASFYPKEGFGFAHSAGCQEWAPIGSIFKLVTGYSALATQLKKGESLHNPLTIIDDKKKVGGEWIVGFTSEGHKIPRYYHGGLLPRTDHLGLGKVDFISAMAASSNPYFALLAGDLEDPDDLTRAASSFGYGEQSGIDLPGEIKGNLPKDVAYNRTGLYSFAIGQHTLLGTPIQTTVMLAAIANGGKILKPKITLNEKGPEIKRQIFLPKELQTYLIRGMHDVIHSDRGTATGIRRQFSKELLDDIVGKSSTAETIEQVSLDSHYRLVKIKQVAFGAISYEENRPELVVVVSLRRGEYGRKAAPMAVRLIEKWREIKKLHSQ